MTNEREESPDYVAGAVRMIALLLDSVEKSKSAKKNELVKIIKGASAHCATNQECDIILLALEMC